MLCQRSVQKYSYDVVPVSITPKSECSTVLSNTPMSFMKGGSQVTSSAFQVRRIAPSYFRELTVTVMGLEFTRRVFFHGRYVRSTGHDERPNQPLIRARPFPSDCIRASRR